MGEPNLIKETRGLESKKSDMMMNAEIEIEKCSTTDFEDGRRGPNQGKQAASRS